VTASPQRGREESSTFILMVCKPEVIHRFVVTPHASTESSSSCSEVIIVFLVGQRLLGRRLHLVTILSEQGLVDVGLWGGESGGGDELLLDALEGVRE
jgi:hypothetical protein